MSRASHVQYERYVEAYLDGRYDDVDAAVRSGILNVAESGLLKARLQLKAGQALDAKKTLLGLRSESQFLQAECLLQLGNAEFYIGAFQSAVSFNLRAADIFAALGDRRGQFHAYYNAGVDFAKLGLFDVSAHYSAKAKENADTVAARVLVDRSLFCSVARAGDVKLAKSILERIEIQVDELSDTDWTGVVGVAAETLFRIGERELALQWALRRRKTTTNREGFRIRYLKMILRHILEHQPIPPLAVDVDSGEYALRWRILFEIQEGERERATSLWLELANMCPGAFGAPFSIADEDERRSPFGLAIDRLSVPSIAISRALSKPLGRYPRLILECMQKAPFPVRKEFIIEDVWKVPYTPALDQRFYKAIQRLRTDGYDVVNINRTYSLRSRFE